MKFNRYLLTLLVVPALFFTARAYAKNISSDIQSQTARPVRAFLIVDKYQNGQVIELSGQSREKKLSQIIDDLDVMIYPEDKISVFPDLYMDMGGKITIERAPKITLIDGKKKSVLRSWSGTVGDLFTEKNIELGQDDKVSLALADTIQEGSEIKINRVAKTVIVEKKEIKYATIKKYDPELEKGNKKLETKGANGSKDVSYQVIRVDGEEVSRSVIDTKVTKEATDEVLIIGTKVITYGSGKATWYNRNQTMVAAHNSLPKGTKVRVVNTTNGKSVVVTIDDRGIQTDAIIDLSSDAFKQLASLGQGTIKNVRIEKYYPE